MKKHRAMSLIGTIIILCAALSLIAVMTPVITRKLPYISVNNLAHGRYEVYRDDNNILKERTCVGIFCSQEKTCDDQTNGCIFDPPEGVEDFVIHAVGAGGSGGSAGTAFLKGSEYMLKDGQGIDFVEGKIDDKLSADSGSASGSPSVSGKTIAVANLNPEAPTNEDYTLQKASVAQTFDLRYNTDDFYEAGKTDETNGVKDTLETRKYVHTLPHQMYKKTTKLGSKTQAAVMEDIKDIKPWFDFGVINNKFPYAAAVACGGAGGEGKPAYNNQKPPTTCLDFRGTCTAQGSVYPSCGGIPSCNCPYFMETPQSCDAIKSYTQNELIDSWSYCTSYSWGYTGNCYHNSCEWGKKCDSYDTWEVWGDVTHYTCSTNSNVENFCTQNGKVFHVTSRGGGGGAGGPCVYAKVETTAFLGLSVKYGYGTTSAGVAKNNSLTLEVINLDDGKVVATLYDNEGQVVYGGKYNDTTMFNSIDSATDYLSKDKSFKDVLAKIYGVNPNDPDLVTIAKLEKKLKLATQCEPAGAAGATRTAEAYQAYYPEDEEPNEFIDSIKNFFHYYYIKISKIITSSLIHQATSTGGTGGAGGCISTDICEACIGGTPCEKGYYCENPAAASGTSGSAIYNEIDTCTGTVNQGDSFKLDDSKKTTYPAKDGALYNYKYKWVMPQASTFLSYGEAGKEGEYHTLKTKITGPVTVFAGMPGEWDNSKGNFNASGKDGVDGGDTTVKGLKNSIDITVKGGAGGKGGLITNRYNLCIAGVDDVTDEGCGARSTNEIEATKERKSNFANISQYVGNSELTKKGNVSGTGGYGAGTQSINNMVCGNTYAFNASASTNEPIDDIVIANKAPEGCENKLKSEYIAGYMFANAKSLKGKTGAVIITW